MKFDIGPSRNDGDFGPSTENAIKQFQEHYAPQYIFHSDYRMEVSGVVDTGTLLAIDEALKLFWNYSTNDDMDLKWLKVPNGQVTFNAEGSDNSASTNFSRVIHWPGNDESGVTVGRGYDCGNRSEDEIFEHMQSALVPESIARLIARSAGLKGEQAKLFIASYKEQVGEITRKSQHLLFVEIYPTYVARAERNYLRWTAGMNATNWEELDSKIRDIAVDFVYQGFTKGERPMVMCMSNDRETLINYIETNPVLRRYDVGRQRANYLRGH